MDWPEFFLVDSKKYRKLVDHPNTVDVLSHLGQSTLIFPTKHVIPPNFQGLPLAAVVESRFDEPAGHTHFQKSPKQFKGAPPKKDFMPNFMQVSFWHMCIHY